MVSASSNQYRWGCQAYNSVTTVCLQRRNKLLMKSNHIFFASWKDGCVEFVMTWLLRSRITETEDDSYWNDRFNISEWKNNNEESNMKCSASHHGKVATAQQPDKTFITSSPLQLWTVEPIRTIKSIKDQISLLIVHKS